jgi:hypothetical protein
MNTEALSQDLNDDTSGKYSYCPFLLPDQAISIPTVQVINMIKAQYGEAALLQALDPTNTIESPLRHHVSTDWIKSANLVGINVRTIHHFWNVVKYALTLPKHQQAIHLLPIWEPGVVASLYGMASWNINPEFFSDELYEAYPSLDTIEKQLKVTINILHLSGRVVGFDAIPHTDRYSEIVLANPRYFEWLQRRDDQITDHRAQLHLKVESEIWGFLKANGPAVENIDLPKDADVFFADDYPESQRIQALFGHPRDYGKRGERRGQLVKYLYQSGYEPVPATMAPPYRGLEVDTDENAKSIDGEGRIWREYKIRNPHEMSRVFGPLTRYKLYDRIDDNKDWQIDFDSPRTEVWEYICQHFEALQKEYHFDFMRGDMSHVQMRPEGVPEQVDHFYDFHKAIKKRITRHTPYFAYFAETFLTAPDFMAYGSEIDHLDQSDADVTLGDLQSMVCGGKAFMANFRWYLDLQQTRSFVPSFTMMTGDKDDPRFDKFYLNANEARLFIGLFLTDMPSYMGLGFECRDPHPEPVANEYYTKLYVFKIDSGSKATKGPYIFGHNVELFHRITRIRLEAEKLLPLIKDAQTLWLYAPEATGGSPIIAWTQKDKPEYIFVVNLNGEKPQTNIKIPLHAISKQSISNRADCVFSTHHEKVTFNPLNTEGQFLQIDTLDAGEGRIYHLHTP